MAELARFPETAELARDRKQRSWKGLGNGGAGPGSETADLCWGSGDSGSLPGLRRRRRWPGLEDGGAGQDSETTELFQGSETTKLAGALSGTGRC